MKKSEYKEASHFCDQLTTALRDVMLGEGETDKYFTGGEHTGAFQAVLLASSVLWHVYNNEPAGIVAVGFLPDKGLGAEVHLDNRLAGKPSEGMSETLSTMSGQISGFFKDNETIVNHCMEGAKSGEVGYTAAWGSC